MPEAKIAASHYESDGEGDGIKRVVNYYAETNPQDPARPTRLATTPGSRLLDDGTVLGAAPRGLFQADGFASGKLLIVDGTTLRTYDESADTFGTLTGTMSGSDSVMEAFAQLEAAFLSGGEIYISSNGTSFAARSDADFGNQLTAHSETTFSSIATLGQRLLFSYGSRFGFSAALDFDNTTSLDFYTAEGAPDGIVRLFVDGDRLLVFGTQTIEPWYQTRIDTNPFNPITGHRIQRGLAGKFTPVNIDNGVAFVGDDRAVYMLRGTQLQNITKGAEWVSRALEGANMATVICTSEETEAHSFYKINAPGFCYVYDFATGTWHERATKDETTYEYAYTVQKAGITYGASRLNTKFSVLSREYYSDDQSAPLTYGTAIEREFTAHLPVTIGRKPMSSIRLEGTKGIGQAAGQGNNPSVSLEISRDKGLSFNSARTRLLGAQGAYSARTVWFRNGRSEPEQTVFKFKVSDFVQFVPTRCVVNEI